MDIVNGDISCYMLSIQGDTSGFEPFGDSGCVPVRDSGFELFGDSGFEPSGDSGCEPPGGFEPSGDLLEDFSGCTGDLVEDYSGCTWSSALFEFPAWIEDLGKTISDYKMQDVLCLPNEPLTPSEVVAANTATLDLEVNLDTSVPVDQKYG